MATAKKSTPTAKLTAVQARERVDELQEKLDKFESTAYCPMCKTHKDREISRNNKHNLEAGKQMDK